MDQSVYGCVLYTIRQKKGRRSDAVLLCFVMMQFCVCVYIDMNMTRKLLMLLLAPYDVLESNN